MLCSFACCICNLVCRLFLTFSFLLLHPGLLSALGSVPSSLCNLPSASLVAFDNNPFLVCYAACLTAVSFTVTPGTIIPCPTEGETAFCSLVRATNIGAYAGYEMWSCSNAGYPITDPCNWGGVTCPTASSVDISLDYVFMTGMVI